MMVRPRLIPARFEGTCPGCQEPIGEGDLIAYDEDEEAWLCEDCTNPT